MKRLAMLWMVMSGAAFAGGGPLGIDHEWSLDQSGIWAPGYQSALEYGGALVVAGGALWLGNDNPLGHTFWQAADSAVLATAATELLKFSFSRARPDQGDNPNLWFQGGSYQSFPSEEVTLQASFVTPFIVNYAKEHPWVWALELLPIYDGIGRIKSQQHWQTDVIGGWLVGSGVGYWSTTLKTPLSVQILPRGLTVGFSKRF